MSEIGKKLEKMRALNEEIKQVEAAHLMKSGMLKDLLADIAVDLGLPKDAKAYEWPDLLVRAYAEAQK